MHRLVADGTLPETHCTDDGVGLVYRGTELVEAVSEADAKAAYLVTREPGAGDGVGTGEEGTLGGVREDRIEPRRLPSP